MLRYRPEKHERQRQWFSPRECQEKIQAWYRDPSLAGEVEPDSTEVSASGKKEKKGGAMETALRAFAVQYGWEKTS
jgi:diphosphoinositol-polyphosphate diphosphatase